MHTENTGIIRYASHSGIYLLFAGCHSIYAVFIGIGAHGADLILRGGGGMPLLINEVNIIVRSYLIINLNIRNYCSGYFLQHEILEIAILTSKPYTQNTLNFLTSIPNIVHSCILCVPIREGE